ncbi:glycerophosphodiester phosphodiesterase [Sinomicrobium sp. FJxs]|uniref:Glycerophosphodiester phosphodiesterase n=2 Tax=Sinomicrobium weinanense TaxID=2842200 RepID=A0A926JP95_9FLAO|nr:glycerophosphodiester phosphodiesterase [Sinomicrobium weinanense]MBU3125625.1 glycerophosphodiester phosphodiesterase [Sinomicrobium weinanense]
MIVTGASEEALAQDGKGFIKNKVIAHRGAFKNTGSPENSLASLNHAIEMGCEGSEFDVWMTADSVLVVNHDADFMGMFIEDTTYKELLQKKYPNGENIPTAEAYIKEGIKQNHTKLIFEIKPSKKSKEHGLKLAEKSVALVHQLNAQNWVDYISFDYDICKKVMELDPKANVAYLNGDLSPAELKKDGFFGLDYSLKVIKKHPEWIKQARENGLTVNVWTVNKKEDMEWLLDEGADFITTNEPEQLLKIISNK